MVWMFCRVFSNVRMVKWLGRRVARIVSIPYGLQTGQVVHPKDHYHHFGVWVKTIIFSWILFSIKWRFFREFCMTIEWANKKNYKKCFLNRKENEKFTKIKYEQFLRHPVCLCSWLSPFLWFSLVCMFFPVIERKEECRKWPNKNVSW